MKPQLPPQLHDFGLSEEAVAGLPEALVTAHRNGILASGFALTVAVSVGVALVLSGSLAAALLFGVLLVCAASILLLPAAVAALCAAELMEREWLCRRFAAYRAWTEYRTALDAHREAQQRRHRAERLKLWNWYSLPAEELRDAVVELLVQQGWGVQRVPSELDTGVDLKIDRGERSAAVRCAAGSRPCGPSLVRELVTCRDDFGVEEVLLVAPACGTRQLEDSLRGRPVVLIDAEGLVAAAEGGGLRWR
jgi:hypothetical protein